MFEHVHEEQPTHLLGRGILGGDEMCHFAKSIDHHHHDGIKTL